MEQYFINQRRVDYKQPIFSNPILSWGAMFFSSVLRDQCCYPAPASFILLILAHLLQLRPLNITFKNKTPLKKSK